jgi:hypothetical protein
MYRARGDRTYAGQIAARDYTGAAATAGQYGDTQGAERAQTLGTQYADRTRGTQIVTALRGNDPGSAAQFAQTPEELQEIQTFREKASANEIAEAQRRAGNFVAALTAVENIADPQQRLAAARQQAPMFGLDPNTITIDQVSPDFLRGQRMRALGVAEYLKNEDRVADNSRWTFNPALGAWVPPAGYVPPGAGSPPQPQGDIVPQLPPGVVPFNQPSSAPAVGGGERNQPVGVSFRSSQDADSAITSLVPGVRVTSGARSPADNRRVGGAPNSFHLQDRARDLVPPAGMSVGQLASKLQQAGFRVLNEGSHVHVSW